MVEDAGASNRAGAREIPEFSGKSGRCSEKQRPLFSSFSLLLKRLLRGDFGFQQHSVYAEFRQLFAQLIGIGGSAAKIHVNPV